MAAALLRCVMARDGRRRDQVAEASTEPARDDADTAKHGCDDRSPNRYVKLVLALGQHDADYVDAYYGPPEWKTRGRSAPSSTRRDRVEARRAAVRHWRASVRPARRDGRRCGIDYLQRQLSALAARVADAQGRAADVRRGVARALRRRRADASRVALPGRSSTDLEQRFPGSGPLVDALRGVPPAVRHPAARSSTRSSSAAIEACRERTRQHIDAAGRRAASPSSTSRTSRGAATTGIRAASAA